ncbi:MAG: NTP transferase domain-containing protein [Nannocystaceae bacterium]
MDHCVALARECVLTIIVDGATRLDAHAFEGSPLLEHNPGWLRRALSHTPDLSGVLVLTVDRPHVHPTTVAALLAAHADAPGAFIQPVHDGRSGHPVVWPHAAIAPILSLRPTDSPRTFLASTAAPPRARTPVQDPAVLDNIDRPAAYQALLQRDHEGPSQL